MAKHSGPKSRRQVADAIKACLDQLAEEAGNAELGELCQLIRVAALAAEDAAGARRKAPPRTRRNASSAGKAEKSTQTPS